MSIAAMARAAEVSQPTVMRFVKALGLEGLAKFVPGPEGVPGRQWTERRKAGVQRSPAVWMRYPPGTDRRKFPGAWWPSPCLYLDDALNISPSSIGGRQTHLRRQQIAVYYVENSASAADLVAYVSGV